MLIWIGLVLMMVGFTLAYPFVRDAIEAQSDPEASLSFVVTLPPAPTQLATVADTSTPVLMQPALLADTPTLAPTQPATVTDTPTSVPTQSATVPATSTSEPTPTPLLTATEPPTTTEPAVMPATSTPTTTPRPTTTATPSPTATVSPSPIPASATSTAITSTATVAPTPAVLPGNSTPSSNSTATPLATTLAPSATSTAPSRIVIPAIQLDAPVETVGWHVEQGTSVWDVPDRRAAGWLKTSAPAGQVGNTVLDGHHNIKGEVFRYLVNLKPYDAIDLYAGSQVYHYAVTEKHILPDRDQPLQIRTANAQWIQPTTDKRLTLVTCWPYTNNTHRLIIVARPLPPASANRIPE
jgi:LPXTG-site transpeptidase (sortase) family protein